MATAIPQNEAAFVLAEIAASCGGRVDAVCADKRVRSVTTDSRAVRSGGLYVALRGERHDGHAFLQDVQRAGAGAALVEDTAQVPDGLPVVRVADTRIALGALARLHRSRWAGKVVAITGSAGKSTTKELTAAALRGLGHRVLSTQGNLNNEIGVPMTLLCLQPSHDVAVVELGTSGPGEIARLAQMAGADIGVVTTVSLAHTLGLGSLEAVADEKCALLRALGKDGVAIYGADSEPLRARKATFGAGRALSFGLHDTSDVRVLSQALGADVTTHCTVRTPGSAADHEVQLGLTGIGPVLDAAAALAVVIALHGEASIAQAVRALRDVAALPGRLTPRSGPLGSLVIDDTYNANPASMLASLSTLVEVARVRHGRAIAALADMAELGEHAHVEHERVGREAVRLGVAELLLCGPEMVHAASSARAALGATPSTSIAHVVDPLQGVEWLRARLRAEDAVLVKGSRSMAMERVVEALCASKAGGA
jgi:UDP-N-acetylmuramoyl-tripeptide--D-alanyl-D-alanine ligase